jgi:hypothetical protein
MKIDIVRQMLADPEFNPTEWLDEAISYYIQNHPEKLVSDKIALPYIIRGISGSDCAAIGRAIGVQGDLNTVEIFCKTLNELDPEDANNRHIGEAVDGMMARLNNAVKAEAAQLLPIIKRCAASPLQYLKYWTPAQVAVVIKHWDCRWSAPTWTSMINASDKLALLPALMGGAFINNIYREPDSGSRIVWPIDMQDIIVEIIAKVAEDSLPDLMNFLPSIGFKNLYESSYDHLAKKRTDRNDMPLDDRICRCGFAASSWSGITLHLQNAVQHQGKLRGEFLSAQEKYIQSKNKHKLRMPIDPAICLKPQVITAARIRLARSKYKSGLAANICERCGEKETLKHMREGCTFKELS